MTSFEGISAEDKDRIVSDLRKLNDECVPMLNEYMKDIEAKSGCIFLAEILKQNLETIDQKDFSQLIIRYIMD